MTTHTKSPAAAILCLGSLLASLASADVTYSTNASLTSDASLGAVFIDSSARLTIESGIINTGDVFLANGFYGRGDLWVNGGTLNSSGYWINVGSRIGSYGEFKVFGGTVNASLLKVGAQGTGLAEIRGGQVNTVSCEIIGDGSNSSWATLYGGVWNNSGQILVGRRGTGNLGIYGGTLTAGSIAMGNEGHQGNVIQSGGTATTGQLYFGNHPFIAVSMILSGGSFTVDTVHVGYQSAVGRIKLRTGGVLAAGQSLLYSLNAGYDFEGGTLQATRNEPNWLAGFVGGSVTLKAAGGIIDTQTYDAGIAAPITGTGALTKTGSGTLTLSGASDYTGGTVVAGGTLALAGSGALATSGVTVNSGAVLTTAAGPFDIGALSGTGSVQLPSGANLNAGADNGSSSFGGTITGTGEFSKVGTGTLTLTGSATQAGPTNIRGGTLAVGTGGSINTPGTYINVANTGTGSFVMNDGTATVDSVVIGHDGGTATVALNGGTLTTREIARWSVPSTIAFNGGTLRAAGNTSVLLNGFTSGSAVIQAGGLTIDTNGFTVSTVAELTGSGPLNKTGSGTLSLEGAYAHTGTTAVNAGTLRLTSARLADTGSVSIATGATLQLDFTGTDTIGSLTLGGVTHPSGTWGAIGSGAQHESALLTGTGRLQVVYDEVAQWLAANGHPGATAGGDEDHDGLTNLDEYYHGSLPGQPNATTTAASHAPGVIEITFDRRKGLQSVSAVVEWSADLAAWSTDGVSAPQVIADQGTTERLRVTVPRPEAAPRRFVRVRPVQPAP